VPNLTPPDAERAAALYRAQRRRAVLPLVTLFVAILGLPLVFALFPALDQVRLFGVPVSWLALAVLPYPALVLLARWHLRHAERIEDQT
jgi:hypothetical protein